MVGERQVSTRDAEPRRGTAREERDASKTAIESAVVDRDDKIDGSSKIDAVSATTASRIVIALLWVFAMMQCLLTLVFFYAAGLFGVLQTNDNTATRIYISSLCAMIVNMVTSFCAIP